MGFFDNVVKDFKQKFAEKEAKKKEEQEFMRRLRLEAQTHEQLAFEREYREKSRRVAEANAKKRAAESSGYKKLQMMNRVRNLSQDKNPGGVFSKLQAYVQANNARRDENLKRTEEIRAEAKRQRDERMVKSKSQREARMVKSNSLRPIRR